MSSYLRSRNIAWGLFSLVTGSMFLVFLAILPFVLSINIGLSGIVVLVSTFGLFIGAGYTCYKKLVRPHVISYSLIRKSKLLIKSEMPPDTIKDFGDVSINPHDKKKCDKVLNTLVGHALNGEWRSLSDAISSIPAVDHLNREKYVGYYLAFRRCLVFTGNYVLNNFHSLYCEKHNRRFIQAQTEGIYFAVCRVCKKTSFGISVKRVILVIDRNATWKTRFNDGTLEINFLMVESLPDFDAIEIGDHAKDDIESFCIKVGNDTDKYRLRYYDKVFYRVQPGISMSRESIALISRFFSLDNSELSRVMV